MTVKPRMKIQQYFTNRSKSNIETYTNNERASQNLAVTEE